MNEAGPRSFRVDLRQSTHKWDWKTKYMRALWEFCLKPFYNILPFKRNRLRAPLLRMMGATIGEGVYLQQRIDILCPWELEIGDFVAIAHDVTILNFDKVHIGSMTVISQYAYLCTGTHDYSHPHFPLTFKPISIGSESWIASAAFIGPGVTVGHGCVIGAYSVVIKDTPRWKVCAGNPCTVIKTRTIADI